MVRLSPKAAHDRFLGTAPEADGGLALKAAVTAAPERGRANRALIALCAESWDIAKRDVTIVAGETDRHKLIELAGAPAPLLARLEAWLARRAAPGRDG